MYKHLPKNVNCMIDYIIHNTNLYQSLIVENSDFYDDNNRYMDVIELNENIIKHIKSAFSQYIDGTALENITLKVLLLNVDYHLVTMALYDKIFNDTTTYRETQEAPTPERYWEITLSDYENTVREFFENKYLNFSD